MRGAPLMGPAPAQGRAVVAAMLEASAKTPEQLAEEENAQREPYYWEDEQLTVASPAPTKLWHNMYWAGEKLFEGTLARAARWATPGPWLIPGGRRALPFPFQASRCSARSSSTSLA